MTKKRGHSRQRQSQRRHIEDIGGQYRHQSLEHVTDQGNGGGLFAADP